MVVGRLVQSAALGIKQTLVASGLLGDSYSTEEFQSACRSQVATSGSFRSWARYEAPPDVFWDDDKYRGEAYAAFAWAVYVAEVTVDLTTYSASVDDFVALQEVGKVLHPVLARGQIAGGIAQGIGYSLYEKVVWQNGRMQNAQMTNYIMPASADLPPIRVFFEARGAKQSDTLKTANRTPVECDDRAVLIGKSGTVRGLIHRKWEVEEGARLPHGEIAGCIATPAGIDRRERRMWRGRVWLLLRAAERRVGK